MKILQVCPKYYPSIGGVEEHVRNISERLAKQHQVIVFAGDPSGKLPREEEINGVLVRRFKSFAPGDAYHISFQMAQALRKSHFDVVHGHSYHALSLFFARYARAGKFVVTPHYHGRGHTPLRDHLLKLYKPFGKRIFAQAHNIIAVSQYEKEGLVGDFNIDENRVIVIPNGVDLTEFSNLEKVRKEPGTILHVGRLEEYKGVQHIIQALPLLNKGFRLDIVGKGPYKGRLVKLIDGLGLSDRVSFDKDLPREELLKMYARAGVFVLLSRHEAFSITTAEALASKTPCIVANTSALKEWVDNKNCFGIDYPADSNKLAELIVKAVAVEVKGIKLWSWEEVARQTAKIYEELI